MQFRKASLVKLLVRKPGSRKFLRATGRWTRRVEKAFIFPNLLNAIHACLARGLREVELVVQYRSKVGNPVSRVLRVNCA